MTSATFARKDLLLFEAIGYWAMMTILRFVVRTVVGGDLFFGRWFGFLVGRDLGRGNGWFSPRNGGNGKLFHVEQFEIGRNDEGFLYF